MSKRGENIYKRKDGRWEARYIFSYNADGKAKYKYLYARTYAEVKTKLIRVQNSIETKVEAEKIRDREKYEFDYLVFRNQKEFCDERAAKLGSPKLIVDVSNIKNPIIKGLKKIFGTAQLLKRENIKIVHIIAKSCHFISDIYGNFFMLIYTYIFINI